MYSWKVNIILFLCYIIELVVLLGYFILLMRREPLYQINKLKKLNKTYRRQLEEKRIGKLNRERGGIWERKKEKLERKEKKNWKGMITKLGSKDDGTERKKWRAGKETIEERKEVEETKSRWGIKAKQVIFINVSLFLNKRPAEWLLHFHNSLPCL